MIKEISVVTFIHNISDVVMNNPTPERILAYIEEETNHYLNIRIDEGNKIVFDGYVGERLEERYSRMFEYAIYTKNHYTA